MIEALKRLFPGKQLSTEAGVLAAWGCDWTKSFAVDPLAVVFPETTEQLVALVRLANESHIALVPSGGRTGLSGGAVAGTGEVVVSLDRMNRILSFEPADRLVRVQAGVVTQTLQEFARGKGLFYPVDFASSGSSQIGGNIATNAGGIKVIRYGLTRDWVAGLKVVTGRGDVLECNRGLVKNATGYDFRHLFIGSEGTLGFIVEADIRLAAAPDPQVVMVMAVPLLADLLKVLSRLQQHVRLSAFEFFSELALEKVTRHRKLRRPFAQPSAFYALAELDAAMLEQATTAFESCVADGWVNDAVVSQSVAQAAELWQLREGISESLAPFMPYKNDVSVKISSMPTFVDGVNRVVADAYPDLDVCWYGHIGDGNLHLNILKPDGLSADEFYARCHHISPRIFTVVQKSGGSISAEHGVGLLKRDFLSFTRSANEIAAMRALKAVFDPSGIMNPGKLLA